MRYDILNPPAVGADVGVALKYTAGTYIRSTWGGRQQGASFILLGPSFAASSIIVCAFIHIWPVINSCCAEEELI